MPGDQVLAMPALDLNVVVKPELLYNPLRQKGCIVIALHRCNLHPKINGKNNRAYRERARADDRDWIPGI